MKNMRCMIFSVLISGLGLLIPALAFADYCVGDNCGAGLGPQWHMHCVTEAGPECWDESDDTCELEGGVVCESGGIFSGGLSGANAEVAVIQVTNEVFTQFVVPKTPPTVTKQITQTVGGETKEDVEASLSEVSGYAQYQFYEMAGAKVDLFGGRLGYEYDSKSAAFGVRVPFQYFTYKDIDFTGMRIGGELYLKTHLINEPGGAWHLGLAGLVNGVKFEEQDFNLYYGGGPFTSVDFGIGPFGFSLGGAGTYTKPDEGDGFITFIAGGSTGVPLGSFLTLSGHGYYSMLFNQDFDEIELGIPPDTSNSFVAVGGEIGVLITTDWSLTAGYDYRFGLGDYKSNELYLGTAAKF